MERKLVSIQRILEVNPIKDADAIEVVKVLGWNVVTKKGEYKAGDYCIYFEIDSVLPAKPEFEFLRKSSYNSRYDGFRLRTVKLRGQISQGLVVPISVLKSPSFTEYIKTALESQDVERYRYICETDIADIANLEGSDITELLGVKKYEIEIPTHLAGDVKGSFPHYVPKTDETRIQASPILLEELKGKTCYVTVKLDGTSVTFANYNGEVDVCSRNLSMKKSETNAYWQIYRKYDIENIGRNVAVQGEIVGPGIQKNPLGLKEIDLFVFNVFDIDKHEYLDYFKFIEFCSNHGLKTVPVISDNFVFDHTIEQLLKLAEGKYDGTNTNREGIVIRPIKETYSETLSGRLSVKIINNDYLLKNEE